MASTKHVQYTKAYLQRKMQLLYVQRGMTMDLEHARVQGEHLDEDKAVFV